MKKILHSLLGCKKEGVSLMLGALGFTLGLFILFAAIRFSSDVIDLLYPEAVSYTHLTLPTTPYV